MAIPDGSTPPVAHRAEQQAKPSRARTCRLVQIGAWGALPLVSLVMLLTALWLLPPFYSWYVDPTYPYLLNGLGFTQGLTPGHTDHPGTSLQLLIGGIVSVAHLFQGTTTDIVTSVLTNPENYLLVTGMVQGFLFAASSAVYSYLISRTYGLKLGFLSSIAAFGAINLWMPWVVVATPETLVASMSLLLSGLLTLALTSSRTGTSPTLLASIGIILGISLTAKVIALPLLVLVAISLPFRRWLPVIVGLVLATAAILFTVSSQFGRMLDWYSSVGTGTARYGQEATTSITENIVVGFFTITSNYPLTWVALLLALAAIVTGIQRLGMRPGLLMVKPVLAGVVAVLFTLSFSLKVSHERDFIILVALVPTLMVWSLVALTGPEVGTKPQKPGRGTHLASLAITATLLLSAAMAFATVRETLHVGKTAAERLMDYNSLPDPRGAVGVTFDVPDVAYALFFGDDWTSQSAFLTGIVDTHPERLEFDPWARTLTGSRQSGTAGSLTCSDVRYLLRSEGLSLRMPAASLDVADQERTGTIALERGLVLNYEPTQLVSSPGGFVQFPITTCSQ